MRKVFTFLLFYLIFFILWYLFKKFIRDLFVELVTLFYRLPKYMWEIVREGKEKA